MTCFSAMPSEEKRSKYESNKKIRHFTSVPIIKAVHNKCISRSIYSYIGLLDKIMNMCVAYWSEIHPKSQGLIIDGFRPNSQRWKHAINTNIFYLIRICSFFIHSAWRIYHSTAKSLIFPNMKTNLGYTHSSQTQ